ncbi:radical SAM protein [archaeon]
MKKFNEPDIVKTLKKKDKRGSAQFLWRVFSNDEDFRTPFKKKAPINVLMNDICNLSCGHCFAEYMMNAAARKREQDPEAMKGHAEKLKNSLFMLFDQFGALKKGMREDYDHYLDGRKQDVVWLSGGEPFLHKDILKIIKKASTCFQTVNVNTNGTFFPLDEKKARKFFSKIPNNVHFWVGIDDWHLAQDPTILQRADIAAGIAHETKGFRLTPFVHFRGKEHEQSGVTGRVKTLLKDCKHLGKGLHQDIEVKLGYGVKAGALYAMGALAEPKDETLPKLVSASDVLSHQKNADGCEIYVRPDGKVVTNVHLGYLETVPDSFVLGDVTKDEPIEIIQKLAKHYFAPSAYFHGMAKFYKYMGYEKVAEKYKAYKQIVNEHEKSKEPPIDLGNKRSKEELGIDLLFKGNKHQIWDVGSMQLDSKSKPPYRNDPLTALPEDMKQEFIQRSAKRFLKNLEKNPIPDTDFFHGDEYLKDKALYTPPLEGVKFSERHPQHEPRYPDMLDPLMYYMQHFKSLGFFFGKYYKDYKKALAREMGLKTVPRTDNVLIAELWKKYGITDKWINHLQTVEGRNITHHYSVDSIAGRRVNDALRLGFTPGPSGSDAPKYWRKNVKQYLNLSVKVLSQVSKKSPEYGLAQDSIKKAKSILALSKKNLNKRGLDYHNHVYNIMRLPIHENPKP